jgi:Mg/Co/Ni transporter MgtE
LTGIYDDSGYLKVVKQFSELQGDDREFKIFRDSNTKNNITKIEIYDKNNLSRKSNYKYNSRNNVAFIESFSPNGDTFSTEEIQYDDNDNILKLVRKDTRRTTEYSYRYDYDKLGNWITFEFTVNGEVKSESKREIRYYQFS